MGRKKRPLYGVVATDSRNPRDGRFIEDLGRYNPLSEPAEVVLKEDRIIYWLGQGAQPSDTVRSILSKQGLMLAFQMTCKGAEPEAIETAKLSHRSRHADLAKSAAKPTARDRERELLKIEATAAAEAAAEANAAREKAEAAAQAEAEAAKKAAAEKVEAEREAVASAANEKQAARNEEQAAEDSSDASTPEAAAPEASDVTEEAEKPAES